MKILVTGSGGREHALVKALSCSPSVQKIYAAPGSDGISSLASCSDIDLKDHNKLQNYIKENNIDLVVIGPEAHLVDGLADSVRAIGTLCVGPSKEASQLEGSKIFAKKFMESAGVPTSHYQVVTSVETLLKAAQEMTPPYVLKADGLAAGKGVVICEDLKQLHVQGQRYFEEKVFGKASEKALIEQFQEGWELSYLILTDGKTYQPLPLAQDHKRLKDNDEGPNTGGMGVISPIKICESLHKTIHEEILKPSVNELQKRKLQFKGVLFVGIMVTPQGPKVIEYNVRFGDPEAQTILPLLNGDWGETLTSLGAGEMPSLKWKDSFSACVVLASEGYPEKPKKGVLIEGDLENQTPSSYFLHAGTQKQNKLWHTNGGRVINAVGLGSSLEEAIKNAYQQSRKITWPNMAIRKDIGSQRLNSNKNKES